MTKWGSGNVAFIMADGYDLMGVSTELNVEKKATVEDITPFGTSFRNKMSANLMDATITQNGWYDDATGSMNEALVSTVGSSRVFAFGLEGNTAGKNCTCFQGAVQTDYQRLAAVGSIHKANCTYELNGQVDECKIVASHTSRSTAGNTDTDDVLVGSVASTVGAIHYIECSQLTLGGYTNLIIHVHHSSDAITYVDLTGVTWTLTTAPYANRIATAVNPTNKYQSIAWTWTGGGSGMSFTAMVACRLL